MYFGRVSGPFFISKYFYKIDKLVKRVGSLSTVKRYNFSGIFELTYDTKKNKLVMTRLLQKKT